METYPLGETIAFIAAPLLLMTTPAILWLAFVALWVVCALDFFYGLNITGSERAARRRR